MYSPWLEIAVYYRLEGNRACYEIHYYKSNEMDFASKGGRRFHKNRVGQAPRGTEQYEELTKHDKGLNRDVLT
jgi:hypothetical protein